MVVVVGASPDELPTEVFSNSTHPLICGCDARGRMVGWLGGEVVMTVVQGRPGIKTIPGVGECVPRNDMNIDKLQNI